MVLCGKVRLVCRLHSDTFSCFDALSIAKINPAVNLVDKS